MLGRKKGHRTPLLTRARGALGTLTGRLPTADQAIEIYQDRVQALGEAQNSVAGRIPSWFATTAHYPSQESWELRRGYRRNPVVYACVRKICESFGQGRFCVMDDMDKVVDHPVLEVLNQRTNISFVNELWTRLIQDLSLTGNAIWEIVPGKGSMEPCEIWRIDPTCVAIQPHPQGFIRGYLIDVGEGEWVQVPRERIIHFKYPDPCDQGYFGIPPLLAAAKLMAIDDELVDQLKITLENKAMPSVALETEDDALDTRAVEEAKRAWRANYGGRRLGAVSVVGRGTRVRLLGMKWNEMALGDVIDVPEARIAQVFGVPAILLSRSGSQSDPTRANYEESKRHLWTDTIIPLQEDVAALLTRDLLHRFPGSEGLHVAFDHSHIDVLQRAKLERADITKNLFTSGLVSRHTAQRLAAIEVHGPDTFHVPSSVQAAIPGDQEEPEMLGVASTEMME